MTALLTLNCPHCGKQLVHVPLDGLTLYYRCAEHGPVILRPLLPLEDDDEETTGDAEPFHWNSSQHAFTAP